MISLTQAQAWYPSADPVHGFDHVLRVYRLAERLANAEGADLEIVLAAVLLHDALPVTGPASSGALGLAIQGQNSKETRKGRKTKVETADDHQTKRKSHHHSSADFAGQILSAEGWSQARIAAVQHCIRAHRFRDDTEMPQTLEAQVLFDADKLDAIGAIGVARAVAYAARAGQPAYLQPSQGFMENEQLEEGERHSAYHEYIFKLRKLKDRLYTTSGKAMAVERHRVMVEYFERLAVETAGES